jgi:glutathione S-transferase
MDGLVANSVAASIPNWCVLGLVQDARSEAQYDGRQQSSRTNQQLSEARRRQLEGNSFVLGDRLSLADIPIGTHLCRYFNLDLPRPSLPNVERWYERL